MQASEIGQHLLVKQDERGHGPFRVYGLCPQVLFKLAGFERGLLKAGHHLSSLTRYMAHICICFSSATPFCSHRLTVRYNFIVLDGLVKIANESLLHIHIPFPTSTTSSTTTTLSVYPGRSGCCCLNYIN